MSAQNEHEFQTVVLAALLHDIGKFAQRAGESSKQTDPARIHADLSRQFALLLGDDWVRVAGLAAGHHAPETAQGEDQHLARIVTLADRLATGEFIERLPEEHRKPGAEPLVSAFSTLFGRTDQRYFPLAALSDKCDLHTPEESANTALGQGYTGLWQEFENGAKTLRGLEFDLLFDRLLALLEKFTLFVPAATAREESDISLFHHLKATAAIAACLFRRGFSPETLEELEQVFDHRSEKNDTPVAYLVGGDVSGVQDFIYNLRYEGALKSLRGRSVYLQLVSEAVAAGIVEKFRLTRANIIYCGGGNFHVLAPAGDDVEKELGQLAANADRTLLQAHHGRLSVVMACQPLTVRDFRRRQFGKAWGKLHGNMGREKRRRFSRLLAEPAGLKSVMGPTGVGGEEPACPQCGEETDRKDQTGNAFPCSMCESLSGLGRSLSRARFMVELPASGRVPKHPQWSEVLAALGREYRFVPNPDGNGAVFVLNKADLSDGVHGFRFIAKHVPTVNGETAELSDIVKQAKGIEHWGVLRADVDHLGEAFRAGLGENCSISRLATLSYLLHYFFSARVQALAQVSQFRDSIYLAYSGGDDLFIVGAWSALPAFAESLRDEFRKFTSQRLNLSAGIFVAPSLKFPLYEAAQQAGEAEGASKNGGRDRLTFLGRTLEWCNLQCVREVKDELVGLLNRGLPRSILTILNSIWQQRQAAEQARKRGEIPMFPVWRLLYALGRLQQRHEDMAGRIEALRGRIVQDNDLHPFLDLITRWAEYETRE